MSGIAGIFNRDGQPVSAEILQRMAIAARHRGPDAINSWTQECVGLSQLLMATTPEAVHETRPFRDASSGTCIVFDGRIDNRAELIAALAGHAVTRQGNTDMELVLRAYLLWGTDCVAKLLGDFAFAIFDSRRRRLFCGRDIAAIKPLYYFVNDQVFVFATEICQVLQHPLVSDDVNEGMVGEILAVACVNLEETIYRDVFRLAAAYKLVVDDKSLQIIRYWDIDPERRLVYRRDEEYVEHFQDIFREAVACRLRCNNNVGLTLSGGLDSPSVAGMAQTIFNASNERKVLESYSLVYPGRDCDESAWIDESVVHWGLVSHRYAFSRFEPAPAWSEQVRQARCLPEYPTQSALAFLYRIARSRGVRVMLSGSGAHTWLGGGEYRYRGLLQQLKIGRLICELRYQAEIRGWNLALSRVSRSLLWPAVPVPLRQKLEASRRRSYPRTFLQEDFIRAIDFDQRVRRHDCSERFSDLAQWESYHRGISGLATHLRESDNVADARSEIEERHPFWDRRLLEFALAIPGFCHQDGNQHKQLLRKSGEKLLPTMVRKNPAQTEVGCVFVEALRHDEVRDAFGSMRVADRGWVSAERVRRVHDSVCSHYAQGTEIPMEDYRLMWPLWLVFATECWQRGYKGTI